MKKVLIVLCLVLVVGCKNTTTNKPVISDVVVDRFARIENASLTQFEHMKYALNRGYHMKELYAVKSRDFNSIYFVGALVNNKIAIWAMGGTKSRVSLTFSMNNYAYKVSGLGMGTTNKDPIKPTDDGCGLLMGYLETKE